MDVRTVWCKNLGFFEIYDVFAWTREGYTNPDIFGQRERSIFSDFVQASFMEGSLIFRKGYLLIFADCRLIGVTDSITENRLQTF